MAAFPFLFFVGIFGAVFAAVSSRRKLANAAWEAAARDLGITLKPTAGVLGFFGKYSMTGRANGLRVTIDTHQSNDTTFTRYRVGYPSLGLGLEAKRQHAFARVGKLLGFQDIEMGDPLFDEAIIVKGNYAEQVKSFLTPSRRVALTGLIELYPGSRITDTGISYEKRGLDSDPRQLISTMRRILSVAQELRAVDRPNREAAERRLAGDVGEALAILEQAAPSGDPFVDFARKEQLGEIRYAQGDRTGAREIFDELAAAAPADPAVDRWAKLGRADPAPPAAPEAEPAGEAAIVAEHLFRKENYSFDTMEIFENEYEGKSVVWSGELKRLRRFDHDRDFGDGPGVKAVFTIAVLGTDIYAGREVDAIVRLPHGAEGAMEVGRTYSFRGILTRCDPAMRNLFVSDASLT
ncbi:MAG: hypothetical protein HKO82_05165 [Acidimicrobiia bacterium]|nr:hypothetical protein [Acidimicrobiia bacterium]